MKYSLENLTGTIIKYKVVSVVVVVLVIGLVSVAFINANKNGTSTNSIGSQNGTKQSTPSKEVPISSVSSFDLLAPKNYKEYITHTNDKTNMRKDGNYNVATSGIAMATENSMSYDQTDLQPVCSVSMSLDARYGFTRVYDLSGDTVIDIANSDHAFDMTYQGKAYYPQPENITDLKVRSKDGSYVYTFPALKAATPNNGYIVYFGATKTRDGKYATIEYSCYDQHKVDGVYGAETISQGTLEKNWEAFDALRIDNVK